MAFQRYRFTPAADAEFVKTLKARVDQYFKNNDITRHANAQMVVKTIAVFTMALAPLVIMLTGVITNIGLLFALWIIMGVGMAAIGTNVMHDALHGSYSRNPKVNKWIGQSIRFLGASGHMWTIQHNVLHHSFTNMEHADEDIDAPSILRFSPHQPLKKIHRYQFIYAWFLYGLSTLLWTTIKDFNAVNRYRKMGLLNSGKDFRKAFTDIVVWKIIYYVYLLVLPLIFIPAPWWAIVLMYITMHFVMGFLLSVVFQAAHVVPETEFTSVEDGNAMKRSWHVHQLLTTANFASGSKVVTWFTGALNYQIEHHLFPNICHVHYPRIAPIVRETAREFKIPYHSKSNFWSAVRAHSRMLRDLGKANQQAAA
jgi:linoleoyl-CoA desaturase